MKYIPSSIFGRFMGKNTTININEIGLSFDVENSLIKIKWQDLIAPPMFCISFFGQIVTLKTANKNYVFIMLAYSSRLMQQGHCQQFWVAANMQRLDTLLSTIKKITDEQYLRQSSIKRVQLAVHQEFKRWFPWINNSKAKAMVTEKLQLLNHYQHWQAQDIDDCRERYIKRQLQHHQHFFDNVESNPLTLHQRRACIIDNDNNLLLAGAGTGKTSVMVGRAGYLFNSQQAQHSEMLLLAYGRKAADQMDERIKDKLVTTEISATTFHSLGLNIIAQVEGAQPSLSVLATDETIKSKWVQGCFERLINQHAQYRYLIIEYFTKYYYVERNDFDFNSLGEYYQYLTDNDIRSLKGDKVKSFGELTIANWLFNHGIEYQYQASYVHKLETIVRRQYQPNFFLPELNVYIEYYVTDEQGNTAPYIDKKAYHEAITWKRNTHQHYQTSCLELSYAQHKQGRLISALEAFFTRQKIAVELLPDEAILESLKESGRITVLASLFCQLVGLYKAADVDSTLEGALNHSLKDKIIAHSADPQQTTKALVLLKPILIAYEAHLKHQAEIDFEDMINKALAYVQTGQFQSPWRYIMVDEFQDISAPRARLVKALRDNNKACSIFAVGDDWQAIYRFSGADLRLTTGFADYFGATTQSVLDKTFRFNNQISKVATNFISKNPAQIHKNINAFKQVQAPAVSLLKRENAAFNSSNKKVIDELENGAVDDVLAAISAKVSQPVSVYLLARFWFQLPSKTALKRLNNQYSLLNIEAQSFHASKGKEADYVIIMGLKKGAHGFPSEKATPALLDALLAKKEAFAFAEERRLFYVALTRAKDRVYIIADMSHASCFVKELIDEHSLDLELDEFGSVASQAFIDDLNCLACATGKLKKRTSQYGAFYSCSHFPRCEHTEQPCANCASPMSQKRHKGFKVCLNTSCQNVIPICEKCNAEMVLRSSKNGEFWGCRNYKGNDPMSCKNGLDGSKINWPKVEAE
ncbi:UvrD-helicase domain-containing protein [Colwellia sp. MB02u-6]|uniref:UvrD-helicase domain-containing protein n=1 Tax=Colwellia sp. MB02u-6 TaxID=2759824 RepID=UPI0015F656AD|nr:UvrD-helicase domain-containing protein [Colwellia sp. MB02u-6]MBA6326737.1 UvrD-helicase domain-containing protein [Colwellia sp. MB02u-6]